MINMKALERTINTKGKIEYNSMVLVLLIITVAVLLSACAGNTQEASAIKRSESMSDSIKNDFTLKDTKGNEFTLSSEKGKKIYIKFWATWCPICLAGIDELSKLSQDKAMDKETEIVTIVSPGVKGEMKTDKFIAWYEKQGYKFRVLLDEGGSIARQFGVRGYPTSVFIDTKGEIGKTQIGHIANTDIDKNFLAIN